MIYVMEKLKEALLMLENVGGQFLLAIVKFVWQLLLTLLNFAKEIHKKSTSILANFVKMLSDWLLERIPQLPLISTAKDKLNSWMQKSPLSFTNISIGFVLILLFHWCCKGNGKTMKAPGKKNARISRRSFESNPKSYFRSLRSKKSNKIV